MNRIIALLILCCCQSADEKRFRQLAAEANSVILKVRPFASVVLDDNVKDAKTLRVACLEGADLAISLGWMPFKDGYNRRTEKLGVEDVAYIFAHGIERPMCENGTRTETRDEICKEWCIDTYSELAEALARARAAAAKEGVEIEPLLR